MALSPDARTLALLDDEGAATVWDVQNGRLKGRFGAGFTEIFFNRRGDRLLAGAYGLMVMADAGGKEMATLTGESIESSLPKMETEDPDQILWTSLRTTPPPSQGFAGLADLEAGRTGEDHDFRGRRGHRRTLVRR